MGNLVKCMLCSRFVVDQKPQSDGIVLTVTAAAAVSLRSYPFLHVLRTIF